MNKIQREILTKLMHKPGLRFNELWNKSIASNKFSYHIKGLLQLEIVEKKQDAYYLTQNGKSLVAFLDGDSGKRSSSPLACVMLIVTKGEEVLMFQRKKEPFFDYWGFPSGKIEFNQYIMEAAAQELKEETGLEAELSIKGLFCSKTFNNNKQAFNHQIYIIKGDNPKGKLLAQTREGKNLWIKIDEVSNLKIFPNIPRTIEVALQDKFTILEMDRYQENDVFIDKGNTREIIL